MTRYELQHAIFKMTMQLYPTYQHQDVYKRLQNLWKRDTKTIEKYYKTMKAITE